MWPKARPSKYPKKDQRGGLTLFRMPDTTRVRCRIAAPARTLKTEEQETSHDDDREIGCQIARVVCLKKRTPCTQAARFTPPSATVNETNK